MGSDSLTVPNVTAAERLAAQTGKTVTIPSPPSQPPARYEHSPLSLPMGQQAAYRTSGPREHFQLRDYGDRWTVQQDSYHPRNYPLQHATMDAPLATAVALGVLGSQLG